MRKLPFVAFGLVALILIGVWVLSLKTVGPSVSERIGTTRRDLATAKALLEAFKNDCGRFPTTREGMWALENSPKQLKPKWRGPYGDHEMLADSFGNLFRYESANPAKFKLLSPGADGIEGGEGDNQDLVVSS